MSKTEDSMDAHRGVLKWSPNWLLWIVHWIICTRVPNGLNMYISLTLFKKKSSYHVVLLYNFEFFCSTITSAYISLHC